MDSRTSAIPNAVATILNFSSGPITLEPVLFCIFLAMKNASFIFSQFRTTLALFAVLLLCFSAYGQESGDDPPGRIREGRALPLRRHRGALLDELLAAVQDDVQELRVRDVDLIRGEPPGEDRELGVGPRAVPAPEQMLVLGGDGDGAHLHAGAEEVGDEDVLAEGGVPVHQARARGVERVDLAHERRLVVRYGYHNR